MPGDTSSPGAAEVLTFLFADLRGYSTYTHEQGDAAASELAARFAAIARETAAAHEGRLLELRGDEALCVFASARQALRAAIALQRAALTGVAGMLPLDLGVGIGVDAGEALPTEGGYRGAALNVAARLCQTAPGGEILATERVVGLTGPVDGAHWGRPQETRLRGIGDAQRVVRVHPDDPLPPPPARPAPPRPAVRGRQSLAIVALVGLVLAAGIVLFVRFTGGVATPANSLTVIDPASGHVLHDVRLPGTPESLAAGFGRIWVGQAGGDVSTVDMRSLQLGQPIGTNLDPQFMAAGDHFVWVFDGGSKLARLSSSATSPGIATRTLWRCTPNHFLHPDIPACGGGGLAVVGHEIWVGQARNNLADRLDDQIVRVQAADLTTAGNIPHVVAGPMAGDPSGVWAFGDVGREVDRVDRATAAVDVIPLKGQIATYTPASVAVLLGAAYAPSPAGTLYRCTAPGDSSAACRALTVPSGMTGVTASATDLWASTDGGLVLELDPFTGQVERTVHLGRVNAIALIYARGQIWVALAPP